MRRTVVTLTCEHCDWAYCTDQVEAQHMTFGGRVFPSWNYVTPPHDCPGGAQHMIERVSFETELMSRHPVQWARIVV